MVRLSASLIKEYENCSWSFYCSKILKFPKKTHPKTSAGSVAHTLLEVLANPRHNHYVEDILAGGNTLSHYAALTRLTYRLIEKEGLPSKWFDDINKLVLAGLHLDFEQEGNTYKYKPEYEFLIKSLDGKYEIRGFIDGAAKVGERIKIRDYKSQGYEFTKEELLFNVQAMIYQYILNKETGLPVDVEFVMLRHDKIQEVPWQGNATMGGFELYLDHMADFFEDFGTEKACSNFAAKDKGKWYKLGCITKAGQIKKDGTPWHCCPYKFPRTIYYVKDKDGKVKYSLDSIENVKLKEGEEIEAFAYSGCKWYFPENYE
jgi:RecB family exonuclease